MNWGINPLRALKKHPNMYARAVIMKPMNNIHISNTKIVVTIELYSGYPFALYMVGWVPMQPMVVGRAPLPIFS